MCFHSLTFLSLAYISYIIPIPKQKGKRKKSNPVKIYELKSHKAMMDELSMRKKSFKGKKKCINLERSDICLKDGSAVVSTFMTYIK